MCVCVCVCVATDRKAQHVGTIVSLGTFTIRKGPFLSTVQMAPAACNIFAGVDDGLLGNIRRTDV